MLSLSPTRVFHLAQQAVFSSLLLAATHARATHYTVEIEGLAFNPSSITIEAGDTVTWIAREALGHSVVSDTLLWVSPSLGLNQTFSYTFSEKGTYPYQSIPFTSARGTVIVRSPDTAPTVTITSPLDGTTLNGPATIDFEAAASDDSAVIRVEYFSGITQLGSSTIPPFRVSASGFDSGTFSFHALAYDNSGKIGTSAPVNVTIRGQVGGPSFIGYERFPDGGFFLNISGTAGRLHIIEAAGASLVWIPIHTNTPATDAWTYFDTKAATLPQRVYRVSYR